MKPKLLLCLVLVLSGGLFGCRNVARRVDGTLQIQLEQMAQSCSHFSLTIFVKNQPLQLWEQNKSLELEQFQLVKRLRELSGNRDTLAALLKNPDPKVRTLALGAIFLREDGRDLPLIASLINDPAKTFPDLHRPPAGGNAMPPPLLELETPQTVGDVARKMLCFWIFPPQQFGDRQPHITADEFADYWEKHAGRKYSASWFTVKMMRATQLTTPIQPEYLPDIQRVVAEMQALPMPDRAWIQIYVLAPDFDNKIMTDDELIATAKKLGPDALLRFLQRKPVSDDPDLLMDKDNFEFIWMCNFILHHADQLLRPKDADALLACEYVDNFSGGVNPSWSIAAAFLQPSRAGKILHNALAQETRDFDPAAGQLAGALWQIRGSAEMDFLVNWFYKAEPKDTWGQTSSFLWAVKAAARPDTKELLAALVKDPRFDHTGVGEIEEILETVNAGRATPLVSERDISAVEPNSLLGKRAVLVNWRNLLRREYGLPEEPVSNLSPQPKQTLTQPVWSVKLNSHPLQIVLSPDGKLLATLCWNDVRVGEGAVQLWETESGKSVWDMPGTTSMRMTFRDAGQIMRLDWDETKPQYDPIEVLTEWDIVTRKQILHTKLYGSSNSTAIFDDTNPGPESICRLCIDTNSGRALWPYSGTDNSGRETALSPDGTLLAASGGNHNLRAARVFDTKSGKLLRQFDEHSGRVGKLAFSADGRSLVTVTAEDGIQLWDVATGKLQRKYPYPVGSINGEPACLPVFSPDGRWLAIPAWTETQLFRIGIFRVETGELQWEIPYKDNDLDNTPEALAFAPDGKTLYACGSNLVAWPLPDANP